MELLLNKLTSYIEKHTKTVKVQNKAHNRKEWITAELVEIINEKNKIYRKLQTNPDNAMLNKNYRELKNGVRYTINKSKREYINKQIGKSPNSPVNRVCPNQKSKTEIEAIEMSDKVITKKKKSQTYSTFSTVSKGKTTLIN